MQHKYSHLLDLALPIGYRPVQFINTHFEHSRPLSALLQVPLRLTCWLRRTETMPIRDIISLLPVPAESMCLAVSQRLPCELLSTMLTLGHGGSGQRSHHANECLQRGAMPHGAASFNSRYPILGMSGTQTASRIVFSSSKAVVNGGSNLLRSHITCLEQAGPERE